MNRTLLFVTKFYQQILYTVVSGTLILLQFLNYYLYNRITDIKTILFSLFYANENNRLLHFETNYIDFKNNSSRVKRY